jgi:hypothetical protein
MYDVPQPLYVRDWVNRHVGQEFPTPMICLYQGQPLLRAQWETTIIEADVIFLPLPLGGGGGGGKNTGAIIAMVVVAVVAMWAGPAAAGALGMTVVNSSGATVLTSTGMFVSGMVSAAVMIGGSMLVNAMFPTQLPKANFNTEALESASPTYSTSVSHNTARLYQMIPESFGTNEQVPDLAALPWFEYDGNEQFLHILLCVGIGEYDIQRISVEDTPIWEKGKEYTGNFPEIEIEIVEPGESITLFPDNIETSPEISGQSLNLETIGPITANSAGTLASELAVDVIFPRGIGYMNDRGGISPHKVSVRFEAQRLDEYGEPDEGWFELVSASYEAATMTAQRHTEKIKVPPGRYQVRGMCVGGGEENPRLLNEVVWAGLKSYLPSEMRYPGITLIAIKARATNSLSQSAARQFRVLHTRKLRMWNPKFGWSFPQPTNSWAWAMAAMCKTTSGGGRKDRQIDLNALYRLDQELSARGDEFCQVIDTRQTVWDLFRDACRCVRAIPRALGSTISWMRDGPNRPVRGVFTPYNIVRDSFSVDYAFFSDDSPDDVILDYVDRDTWLPRDVRANMPTAQSRGPAREPARKRFMGITSRAQAYREACFEVACNEYRRIFPKWSTEMEGKLLFRGDMVLLTHPLGGESQWASVTGWNEETNTLLLDASLPWEEPGKHYIVLRKRNGTPYGPVKVETVGEKSLTLDATSLSEAEAKEALKDNYRPLWQWLSDGNSMDATAVIYGRETPGLRAIILSVRPRQNGICEIEAVLEDERVHTADLGEVPPWAAGDVASVVRHPTISGLSFVFDDRDRSLKASWIPHGPAVGYEAKYSVRYKDEEDWCGWNDLGTLLNPSVEFIVPAAIVEFKVRPLTDGFGGLWMTNQVDCSIPMPGKAELSLSGPYTGGNLAVSWPLITAESITAILTVNGIRKFIKEIPGTETSAVITAEEVSNRGGPWRMLELHLLAKNGSWEERSNRLEIAEPPPDTVHGLTVDIKNQIAHLTWQPANGNATGYVVGHTNNSGVVERHETGAASIDIPVSSGRHSFTAAAKDAFYDIAADVHALNFCNLIEVEVA